MAMRIRLVYTKNASLRYTGTLDMQRSWERTLRRARLPIAYSQGFHPQPRINQASALPLGFTSRAEMVDLWLDVELPLDQIREALDRAVPPGIELIEVLSVTAQAPSVQTITQSAEYRVSFRDPQPAVDEVQCQVERLLRAEQILRKRREKTYDLRPLIEDMGILLAEAEGTVTLWMRLAARASATGRPDEVLEEMGFAPSGARIERTRLELSA